MKMNKKLKKGFTLVELVVVIAVIAILAGVSVGAYFGITDSANQSRCDQEAKAFHTALMLIANDPNDKGAEWTVSNNVETLKINGTIEASIEEQLGYKIDVVTAGEKESADPNAAAKVVDGNVPADFKAEVSFSETTFTYGVAGKTTTIEIKTGSKVTPNA